MTDQNLPPSVFEPIYFDGSAARRVSTAPTVTRAMPMPGALVPRFARVGAFWVPEGWYLQQDATRAVQACPVRRRIVCDVPPIDLEALWELGELLLMEGFDGRDVPVRVAEPTFVYAPEFLAQRGPRGEGRFTVSIPAALLLVPRRKPRAPSRPLDVRDAVEVVCVFCDRGEFHAAPLAECWRFELAWGPNPPTAGRILAAMAARDAAALSPATVLIGPGPAPNGQTLGRRLSVPTHFTLDAEDTSDFLQHLYEMALDGIVTANGRAGMADAPTPVLRLYPGDRDGWVVELVFAYGDFVVPAYDAPPSADASDRERFIVREFATEEAAQRLLTTHFGERDPEDAAWHLSTRRIDSARWLLRELRDTQHWRVEIAHEPPAKGRRRKRVTGPTSAPLFRDIDDAALHAASELAHQRSERRHRALGAAEADDIGRALEADSAPGDTRARRPRDADVDRRGLARALDLLGLAQTFARLARLRRKVAEVRRLEAVQAQRPEGIDAAVAEAQANLAARGVRLMAHQRDALRGVLRRLRVGHGVILALPAGYGRTLVALLVAGALRRLGVVDAPILWVGTKPRLSRLRGDLERFLPGLRVCDYTGGRHRPDFGDVDLVMTNSELARGEVTLDPETGRLTSPLLAPRWGLLVIDELPVASTVSFRTMSTLRDRAQRVLLLDTPMRENSMVDLWTHLELVSPGSYGARQDFTLFERALRTDAPQAEEFRTQVRRDVFACTVDERQCSAEDARLPALRWLPVVVLPLDGTHADRMHALHVAAVRSPRRHKSMHRLGRAVLEMRRGCHAARFLDPADAADADAPRAEAIAARVAREFAAGHHCIVFCQWLEAIELIAERLTARGFGVDVLAHPTDMDTRTALARKWGTSGLPPADTAALVAQPQAVERGTDLVGADRVIFAEPFWNPGLVHRCVGRVYRTGQTREVDAVMFASDAIVERLLLRRAESEQALIDAIIGGERRDSHDALCPRLDDLQMLDEMFGDADPTPEREAHFRRTLAHLQAVREVLRRERADLDARRLPAESQRAALEDLALAHLGRDRDTRAALDALATTLALAAGEVDALGAVVGEMELILKGWR
jgi:superfamily II DNA or RNA helicase